MHHRVNPIIVNEMRSRMRGCRAYAILTIYLIILSCGVGSLYTTFYANTADYGNLYNITTPNVQEGATLGKLIFAGTIMLLLMLISHIAPAFTAASISGERERQTYDVLIITPMKARKIVWGKLGGVFLFLLLMILTSLPVQSLAFLFGGVELTELLIAALALSVTALAFGALGLFISSHNRTSMSSIVITYSLILPFIYGLPFFVLFLANFLIPLMILLETTGGQYNELVALLYGAMLFYGAGFLLSINPFSSAALTMGFAANGQGYFFFTERIQGMTIWLVSPWLVYVIFYSLLTIWLVHLTTRRLNKISRI